MDGATRTENATDDQVTTPGDDVGRAGTDARADAPEDARPLVRHGTDFLDLLAEGVPFAVAHDVRAATPRPAPEAPEH